MNVVAGVLVIIFLEYQNFSVFHLIVVKLWLLIGDNIPDVCIVSDF